MTDDCMDDVGGSNDGGTTSSPLPPEIVTVVLLSLLPMLGWAAVAVY